MSDLAIINDILNEDFRYEHNSLVEDEANMSIDIDTRGCKSYIFQFDKKLGREYKGGIFPFFNSKSKNICKVCDFMIFSEHNKRIYVLIIELKKGKQATSPQISAGECFISFLNSTISRVHKKSINLIVRKVSIRDFERKRKTKIQDVTYDENHHHFFQQDKFVIRSFLK